ncbi:MAG: tetratricopeptide repeat protein [Terriglobia bacterium]
MSILSNRIIISLVLLAGAAAFWEFKLRPVSAPLYMAAVSDYHAHHYRRSMAELREGLKFQPNDRSFLALMGWDALKMREAALADTYFRRAGRFASGNPNPLLGEIYADIALQRYQAAKRLLSEMRGRFGKTAAFRTAQTVLSANTPAVHQHTGLPAVATTRLTEPLRQEILVRTQEDLARAQWKHSIQKVNAFAMEQPASEAAAGLLPENDVASYPFSGANPNPLRQTGLAADVSRWRSLRPAPESPPQAFVSYYLSYLAGHPRDATAFKSLAVAEARLGNYPAAIDADHGALRLNPQDQSAQAHLALVLSWNRQYSASIEIYRALLQKSPKSLILLQSLSRVYLWSGQRKEALQAEKQLQALNPSNEQYELAAARLEMDLEKDGDADKTLHRLLNQHPQDTEARILEASLEQKEGRLEQALKDYDSALGENFENAAALYGAAQIDFYLGRPSPAYPLASRLVAERPADFDALVLLARIDRARGSRKAAMSLLSRAAQLSPDNRGVQALETRVRGESAVTIHTTASYAREVALTKYGHEAEDLNSYGGNVRIGFKALPRSQSYLQISSMPSNSPEGILRGTVAPSELLYGQTTEISRRLVARGGLGVARTGAGFIPSVDTGPLTLRSPEIVPVGFGGFSFIPSGKLRLDFTLSRQAITDTPVSVQFGAMKIRLDAGIRYVFSGRTHFTASVFHERDSTPVYMQTDLFSGQMRDSGSGVSVKIRHDLVESERFSLQAGYSGLAMGYAGERKGIFMGFFNPRFYTRHFATSRLKGTLWGPLDYTLIADLGLQQIDQGLPATWAYQFGPSLTLRFGRGHSITAGYLHYNSAELFGYYQVGLFKTPDFGKLDGNALTLSSDWSW